MLRNPGWYQMVFDYDASTVDRYTEALMVKMAATPLPPSGENVLQQALRGYTLNDEGVQHGLKFYKYEWEGKSYSCDSYERYWHGYLVFLKPLLYFFSLHDIMFLNIAAQMLLMFVMLYFLRKRGKEDLQIPFMILWIISMQAAVMFSIDYAACFYIYMIAALLLISGDKAREKYIYIFMAAGMCTSYMDFLTWPLITLGIPLVVYLYMEKDDIIRQNKKLLTASAAWTAGYVGQWAGKWLLASVVLGENIIGDAIASIGARSSNVDGDREFGYLEVLSRNVGVLAKKSYILVFCAIIIWILYRVWKGKGRAVYGRMLPYAVIMLYPAGWYLLTRNHSWGHYWMTWRILAISVFAFVCGVLACLDAGNQSGG